MEAQWKRNGTSQTLRAFQKSYRDEKEGRPLLYSSKPKKEEGTTRMDSTTYEQLVGQYDWPKQIEAKSLYRALEQVTDGRDRRGVRYSVAFVLTLILLGKFVGEVKLSGIAKSGALAQRVGEAAPGARARQSALCRNLYLRVGTCGC